MTMIHKTRKNFQFGAILLPFILIFLIFVSGCDKSNKNPTPLPRPVLAFRAEERTANAEIRFAGTVQPRYQTALAFRVPGKILTRKVNVGDRVHKGQLLAILDDADYQLAAQALKAQLNATQMELTFSKDNLGRYKELYEQKLISLAELDKNETSYKSAKERLVALTSQYQQAVNQVSYTQLQAEREGWVTQLAMETNQMVQAGQTVMQLAQVGENEVLINLPEQLVNTVKIGQKVTISFWVYDNREFQGEIREISQQADPASRTYAVKIKILAAEEMVRLGMTASVDLNLKQTPQIAIPITSLFTKTHEPNQSRVWIINERQHIVSSITVKLGELLPDERVAVLGLKAGQLIVSAGAHRLQESQSVRILEPKPKVPEVVGQKL